MNLLQSFPQGNLNNAEVGDRIAVKLLDGYRISRVKRVTKTQIVLDNDTRFKKDTGFMIGAWMIEASNRSDIIEEVEFRNAMRKVLK